jgi:hypothetical protein
MNKVSRLLSAVALIALVGTFSACKKTFDEPPGPSDPNITANTTIANLKAIHTSTSSGAFTPITQDIVISGIVTANDKSGNFYKQLFIQDTTGAIQVLLNATNLYTTYPVGRRVYIKCNGLYISDDNGNMILGSRAVVGGIPSLEGIPSAMINRYVIGGSINNPVTPMEVTYADLGTDMQNRYINALIKLMDYHFVDSDTGKTYSDTSVYRRTTNRNINKCDGSNPNLIVRTSAYSNFSALTVPRGVGDIVSIYTVFGTTRQLVIRDTNDVMFFQPRCGEDALLLERFEGQTAFSPVNIADWKNLAEVGGRTYSARTFNSNLYAELSAFSSNEPIVLSWLVTKGVNLDATANEKLSFDTKQGFIGTGGSTAAALKILVSTNYTGAGDPWDASVTWTDVTAQATLSPGTVTSFPSSFTNSGEIDLSGYTGTVYVAFRYEGSDPSGSSNDKTSTWQIDNIKITGN